MNIPATATSTAWQVSTTSSPVTGSLTCSVNGGAATPFSIKGVCYSPCPINGANSYGPNLGDWFWDSFSGPGYTVTGWSALWQRDLPNLKSLGVNTIRVYNMMSRQINYQNGSYPQPWNSETLFTHTDFLDQCLANGISVLVGVALSEAMYWLYDPKYSGPGTKPAAGEISFWTNVLEETATQVGSHPAVMGFVIMNEWDSCVVTYPSQCWTVNGTVHNNTPCVKYFWSQIQTLAKIVKTAAPTKLVGIAVHDNPNICGFAASYMAQCPSVDFWGVNSYQTQNFNSVFGPVPNVGPGYAGLTGAALKPVILTEFGMPATTRYNPSDPSTIEQTTASIQAAANVVASMLPQAYQQALCLGLCYFEYSDEWWNQGGSPNIYTWWGGSAAAGFPNGYWDQDGFGLYQTIPGCGANGGTIYANNAPCTPLDSMNARTALTNAIIASYS